MLSENVCLLWYRLFVYPFDEINQNNNNALLNIEDSAWKYTQITQTLTFKMFTAKTQKSCCALHWSMMHVCTRCVVVQTSWTIFKFIGLCLSPLCRFVAAQWVSVLSFCLIWHVSHLTALINPSGIILYTNYACNGKRKMSFLEMHWATPGI